MSDKRVSEARESVIRAADAYDGGFDAAKRYFVNADSRIYITNGTTGNILTIGGNKVNGKKIAVVCNGQQYEFDKIEEAQAKAEELAHQHNADAFILKPIKKVSPKRDVVTVDL